MAGSGIIEKQLRCAFVAAARLCVRCCGVVACSLFQDDDHAWLSTLIAHGRYVLRIECSRTLEVGHQLHKEGGLCAQICRQNVDIVNELSCAGKADFVHGLHTQGFVYVNVLCVVIVFLIVAVLYFCDMFLSFLIVVSVALY